MNERPFTVAFAVAAALGACGGRAQILGADQPSVSDVGSTAYAGARDVISVSHFDAGTDAAADETGAGGEAENGGAPEWNQGGTIDSSGGRPSAERGGSANSGGAAGSGTCASSPGSFATEVLSHAFGGGQNANQSSGFPQVLLGPPFANDPSSVVSLGNGGWVILGFGGTAIVDGPGVDFTVFENPLPTFKELATVSVSEDAEHWTEFPCSAPQDAKDFGFCAGVGIVHSSPKNGIDPFDPVLSGGDHYDLADIGVAHARFVRITDRVDLSGSAGVFDLDAVAVVHAQCQ